MKGMSTQPCDRIRGVQYVYNLGGQLASIETPVCTYGGPECSYRGNANRQIVLELYQNICASTVSQERVFLNSSQCTNGTNEVVQTSPFPVHPWVSFMVLVQRATRKGA